MDVWRCSDAPVHGCGGTSLELVLPFVDEERKE